MPHRPDLPCADCGKLMWSGNTSLPAGKARCLPCRRANPAKSMRDLACAVCHTECRSTRRTKTCSHSCHALLVVHERTGRPLPDPAIQRERVQHLAGLTAEGRARERNERASARKRLKRLHQAETWDGISDQKIYERDGWRCGICTKKIRQTLRYPHPMSPSIDHVIPLAHGGDDTAVNKRAAHLHCNTSRGVGREGEASQLALFSGLGDPTRPTWVHGQSRRPAQPRPKATCTACGSDLRNKRCWTCEPAKLRGANAHPGTVEMGQLAARLRVSGMKWQDIADVVGYQNLGNLYTRAMQYGDPEDVRAIRPQRRLTRT
jgi:hypothetical protein